MAQFCLKEEHTTHDTDLHRLLSELMNAKGQPVFRTYVPDEGKTIILCTTNEKVHLGLGKLSDPGLMVLAKLFREKMGNDSELVFTYQPKDGEVQPRNLFVTASKDARGYEVFHLAPGH